MESSKTGNFKNLKSELSYDFCYDFGIFILLS